MNSKLMKVIRITGIVLVLIISVGGCALFGPSQTKEEVLASFFSDVKNANYSSAYENIHPDNSYRNAWKVGSVFDDLYENDGTGVSYSITSKNGDSYTVQVTYSSTAVVSETFTFKINDEVGLNYYQIRSLTVKGTPYN